MVKTNLIGIMLAAVVILLVPLGCPLQEEGLRDYSGAVPTDVVYDYGDISGTESTHFANIWVDNEQLNPVCTDDSTDYHLFIGADDQIPAASHITGSIPSGEVYFRLDAYAAVYSLDKGECNYNVNRSDMVVDFVIEGSYKPATYKFTIFTCGNDGTVAAGSEIFHTTDIKVSGNVVCKVSDEMKYVFSFTDMVMLGGVETPTPEHR